MPWFRHSFLGDYERIRAFSSGHFASTMKHSHPASYPGAPLFLWRSVAIRRAKVLAQHETETTLISMKTIRRLSTRLIRTRYVSDRLPCVCMVNQIQICLIYYYLTFFWALGEIKWHTCLLFPPLGGVLVLFLQSQFKPVPLSHVAAWPRHLHLKKHLEFYKSRKPNMGVSNVLIQPICLNNFGLDSTLKSSQLTAFYCTIINSESYEHINITYFTHFPLERKYPVSQFSHVLPSLLPPHSQCKLTVSLGPYLVPSCRKI